MQLNFTTRALLAFIAVAAVLMACYTYTPSRISFKDLKLPEDIDLEAIETADLPQNVMRWHKKRVHIVGFIMPASVTREHEIRKFVLVRDNQMCSPGPSIDDLVVVNMVKGRTADFTVRPVIVSGRLFVTDRNKNAKGEPYAIYEVQATALNTR